eukprot:2181175-Amphidinium_carterae.1
MESAEVKQPLVWYTVGWGTDCLLAEVSLSRSASDLVFSAHSSASPVMSESLETKAIEIGLELQLHKLTGLWVSNGTILPESPMETAARAAGLDRARRRRRTKLEVQRARELERAHRDRLERERVLAAEKNRRTKQRAARRLAGSAEARRSRWRQQKATQRARKKGLVP